jgi:putative copper export protein
VPAVSATDLLLLTMRWLHATAAIVWIGAICFELLVALPALDGSQAGEILTRFDAGLRDLVQTALIVFLVSGAILTVERLSHSNAGTPYAVVLFVKIVLSVVMFQVGYRFRAARSRRRVRGLRILAALGLTIVFLATVLTWLYERALLPS